MILTKLNKVARREKMRKIIASTRTHESTMAALGNATKQEVLRAHVPTSDFATRPGMEN